MEYFHPFVSRFTFNFGASIFPFKSPFKKCFKIAIFFDLAPRSGFGAAIPVVIMYKLLCVKTFSVNL